MTRHIQRTPVDHGYSWVILAACFGMYTILAGSVKSGGILYAELLDYYEDGAGETAWVTSLCFSLQMILGPFSNYFAEILSFRLVTFCGGISLLSGYLLSAFMSEMKLLYLTFGLIAGLGYGCIYSPCSTILIFFFEKRRALANGLMVSGSGIGNLLFPYLYRYLIDEYGLRGAFILISGILFNVCVFATLFRQPGVLKIRKMERKREQTFRTKHVLPLCQSFSSCIESIFDFSLLKSPQYIAYLFAFTFNLIGYIVNVTIFPAHIESLGYGKQRAAICVSIIGASSIFARPFFGWVADLKVIQTRYIVSFSCIVSGIFAVLMPLLHSFPTLVLYASIVGIFPGAFWSLIAILLVDCVGIEKLRQAFGIASFCMGLGFVLSPPVAGWLEDLTGTWDHSFQFAGVASLLAGIILLMERKCSLMCESESKKVNNTVSDIDIEIEENGVDEIEENEAWMLSGSNRRE